MPLKPPKTQTTQPVNIGITPGDITAAAVSTVQIARQPPRPLGVERDFEPPGRPWQGRLPANFQYYGPQTQTIPQYYADDVLVPGRWPQARQAELQQALIQAGLLSEDAWAPGIWNAASQTAYRKVLEYANQNGLTKDEALGDYLNNPTIGALKAAMKKAGGGGGRTVTLVNPQDLQAVANQVAPEVIGRRLTQAELDHFVGSFHSAQRSGGNPPSPEVAAQAAAEEAAPTEATARDLKGVFDVAINMMRGGGNG